MGLIKRLISYSLFLMLLSVALPVSAVKRPGPDRLHYLDNGLIRVGVDVKRGGAIHYLARSSHPEKNYINQYDPGRLVQRSYFGPPYIYNAWKQHPAWPWNPVQGGDVVGNGSDVSHVTNNGRTIYVRTLPLNWADRNAVTDCFMENWISLEKHAVRIESKFSNGSGDHNQWRDQEQLAVYVVTALEELCFYGGVEPFTKGPIQRLKPGEKNVYYQANEFWAAWVNSADFGVGVFAQDVIHHTAFRVGQQGLYDDWSQATNYLAAIPRFSVPAWSIYKDVTYLILDSLENIRDYVYRRVTYPSAVKKFSYGAIKWGFDSIQERNGWAGGWDRKLGSSTIHDHLGVQGGNWSFIIADYTNQPPSIISPHFLIPASTYSVIELDCQVESGLDSRAALEWNSLSDSIYEFPPRNSQVFTVTADGQWHRYTFMLSSHPGWTGKIRQLRIRSLAVAGATVRINYIQVFSPGFFRDSRQSVTKDTFRFIHSR